MALNLESVTWHAFFIEDIAKIISGRDIYDAKDLTGKYRIYLQLLKITELDTL